MHCKHAQEGMRDKPSCPCSVLQGFLQSNYYSIQSATSDVKQKVCHILFFYTVIIMLLDVLMDVYIRGVNTSLLLNAL